MATYCVFDVSGRMEQCISGGGKPAIKPGERCGTYESQEMLPASKLGIVAGQSRLIGEDTFQIDTLEAIEARAEHHGTLVAEQRVIELTGTILVLEKSAEIMRQWARPAMLRALDDRKAEREKYMRIMRGQMPPEVHIDPNLMRIAGETFHVKLDPILAPGH